MPGIGKEAVRKLSDDRGGVSIPITTISQLMAQFVLCRRPDMVFADQEEAFFKWLKTEKKITHARHDITRAISDRVRARFPNLYVEY